MNNFSESQQILNFRKGTTRKDSTIYNLEKIYNEMKEEQKIPSLNKNHNIPIMEYNSKRLNLNPIVNKKSVSFPFTNIKPGNKIAINKRIIIK